MPHAVVLSLDPRAEEGVRRLWDGLGDARLAVALRDGGATPHLTLAVFRGPDEVNALAAGLQALEASELALSLGHIGVFPGEEGVVFAGVTPTAELLALHESVHALLDGHAEEVRGYYQPGRWVPHVTLAIRLDGRERAAAVRWLLNPAVGYPSWPLKARGVALTLLELPGDRRVTRIPLAPPPKPV